MKRFILTLAIVLAVLVFLVPWLGLANPTAMNFEYRFAPPSAQFWLGADDYGRDLLSRLAHGARISIGISLLGALIACLIGVTLGLAGGWFGGLAELIAVRSMDVILCIPPILMSLLVVTVVGPGATTLLPLMAIVFAPAFVRITYVSVLGVRSQDYVTAMRAMGASSLGILVRTVLPNISGPIIVQLGLTAAAAIVLETGMSFLGLGVVPPMPSWGNMIANGRSLMQQAPMLLVLPCLALSLTILLLNACCDLLRDRFDPQSYARLIPLGRIRPPTTGTAPARLPAGLLELDDVSISISMPGGSTAAVRNLSLSVAPGETLAVVGESGSGKSLTGLSILGLLPEGIQTTGGRIWFDGQDLRGLDEQAMRQRRGRDVAMIFQNPLASLNPIHRVGDQIAEALSLHGQTGDGVRDRVLQLLKQVGISDPEARMSAYPHEMSGGMLQRIMIAMAIANRPRLLIADEPTTALDVTIQAQVLDVFERLKHSEDMAIVFITHSLPVVAEIASRVVVMYAGEVVEQGPVEEVFARPLHPYTAALLESAPREDGTPPLPIPGIVPLPNALPKGCAFGPRCRHFTDRCGAARPGMASPTPARNTRCIRWNEIAMDVMGETA